MCHSCCVQIVNTSSGDGSIKILSEMGLQDEKQRREDPHGRSLLPYKMSKVKPRAVEPCTFMSMLKKRVVIIMGDCIAGSGKILTMPNI